ncbi:MAG: EAL domain-containing protein, partial [Wenzhouxiangellaceae bacterium]
KPRIRRARTVLESLRELGVSVTLSGVDEKVPEAILLHHLPADYIRMNADFARRLINDHTLADRFQRFTQRARGAGRRLIVTMLEDAEEVSRIWQMDVDLIQGNFIQQPTEQPDSG